jgi:peptide/nickel transport system ATP-binding protein
MLEDQVLAVQNLGISFKGTQAVNKISFQIPKGKTLGIVGESGSGKSVTSLAIMRLISAPGTIDSGSIQFRNRKNDVTDLLKLSEREMRQYRGNEISMIFQEPMTSLNPVYTCGYQVIESLRLHTSLSKQDARERAIQLFKQVELPRPEKMLKAYPHQISGGQKQRVMIAMAISCNPSLLIADEPTTALDVTVQQSILALLRQLQEAEQMSTIFISHDLGVIAEVADEVLVMYKGNVVESGSVLDIFENPQHPYTKGLLACRPPLDKKLYRLPTIGDFMEREDKEELQNLAERPAQSKSQTQSQAASPLLRVHKLKTWFPLKKGLFSKGQKYVKAVDDLSFEVFPGEALGLVGESGCGKTTLGRSILRLEEPTDGEVFFGEKSLTKMSQTQMRNVRKEMQIIFQDPYSSLNPRLPIGKAIMEPMLVHKLHGDAASRKAKALELLEKVGLSGEYFERYPHEFSGGQRQRVCIARALAVEPRFIICDESVSALDVSIQAQVLNLLKELQEEFGFTYIFISHDLSVVRFLCDRVMVMKEGKIVEMGQAEDIYENPHSPYTQKLLAAIPKGSIEEIKSRIHKN